MLNRILGLALISMFLSQFVFADIDTVQSSSRGGRRGGKRNQAQKKQEKSPDTIRGRCSVAVSENNPLAGACVNTVMVLRNKDGEEVAKTRTSDKGIFEFNVKEEKTKDFKIDIGSKLYDLISPPHIVHPGDSVAIQIQQKP